MKNTASLDSEHIEVCASGQCMRFLINDGQVVIIKKVDVTDILIGDIVVFRENEGFLIHRVLFKYIKNGKTRFLTKGDMSFDFDRPVEADQIEGKVMDFSRLYSWSVGMFSFVFFLITKLPVLIKHILFFIAAIIISLLHKFFPGRKAHSISGQLVSFLSNKGN
ncbi:MAG: signal peptidase I [Elusimicrobia bacterium RIFOXYA2_FULL_40_6]|nr:MAG: signal peptidase I [Elusimicrobia bacterium RIFOXYA2_FULL_40_6]